MNDYDIVITWQNTMKHTRAYDCAYCGKHVAPREAYNGVASNGSILESIQICNYCNKPTYFDSDDKQMPAPRFGESVENLPENIKLLYNEARDCMSVIAYTAAVLVCRKLLMHIAVEKGAKEGASFKEYVGYLSDNHFVPPDSKAWVGHIRDKGNEANHEIVLMKREEAEQLIEFISMLMKIIYDLPNRFKAQLPSP